MPEQKNPGLGKDSQYETIHDISNRLADTLLVCISIFGAPIVLVSILRYLRVGGIYILALHLFVYLFCLIFMAIRKKVSVNSKCMFIIVCTFIMGIASLVKWGIFGTGAVYFIFMSILTTVFYGARRGSL
jgi:hypothetical protein